MYPDSLKSCSTCMGQPPYGCTRRRPYVLHKDFNFNFLLCFCCTRSWIFPLYCFVTATCTLPPSNIEKFFFLLSEWIKEDWLQAILQASKIEEYCTGVLTGLEPFKLTKSADVSYLPRGNGFVCGPKTPLFVSLEYWGLNSTHFLLLWPFILIREWSRPQGHT